MNSQLTLIPRVTIHPDKICLYKEVQWSPCKVYRQFDLENNEEQQQANESFLRSQRKNNGFLSKIATRKLFKAIDYLIITSDKKKVFSKLQKKYITYRIVFVTLTLPSRQIHSDKKITNTCLNQLFVELAKYHNVKKYVWRAEKQHNGNIHYHILINQFIEYQELRKRWNRICNKLGYVDQYQKKMKEFYSEGFRPTNFECDKRSIEDQRKAYVIGQKSNWTSPNSTDIHNTRKVTDIKKYVGKYMCKNPDVNLESNDIDNSTQIVNGRLWSCSQNLSNVEGCQLVEDWEISDELEKVAENSGCKIFRDVYFSVLFIDATKLKKFGSDLLFKYFSDYLISKFDYHLQVSI